MEKSIEVIEENGSKTILSNIPADIRSIASDFKGLAIKWNSMDYIHLYTQVQKLNIAAAVFGLDNIRNIAYRIELLLSKYEYDIPATPGDMRSLAVMIEELTAASRYNRC